MNNITKTGVKPNISHVDYAPKPGHWDEALVRPGVPRQHWRKLASVLGRMGYEQLGRRWQAGQQLIQAHGVTYNVYGDPQGKERPWLLDPIPLVMDSGEWAQLELAVKQRATLLNAILGDLYGSQSLIHGRKFPAALLFGNPQFLRPCCGIIPPREVFMHTYAVDLARSPSGKWWVLSDRTQAPSGMGYTLENRLVSARTLPSVFSQCPVRQLNRFFERRREALMALAPNRRSSPRIVLLTPGPNNETYFEHAFLARHWGFPLVEGADLTVRDERVYMKTLDGLEPVDLILRRMDDNFCDPLELRADSLLGVPGLMQAMRSGHVAVANALGSGLLESSAQMPFLPGLCRHLLGEPLRMPSVATWWCGQEGPRNYVLKHLKELVIKPAFPGQGRHTEFPATMSVAALQSLARRISADPDHYVAQEQVALSTAPVLTDKGLTARHVVVRVFAAWDGEEYSVLPGGLARVSTEPDSLVVSMQLGGGSKDTWILTGNEVSRDAARQIPMFPEPPSIHTGLPSRVADNLYWLGRYTERVEAGARMVRSLLPSLSSEEDYGRTATLDTAVRMLVSLNFLPDELPEASLSLKRWQVQRLLASLVYDPSRMGGLGSNLQQVRHSAWPLKERLSNDTWRVLQQLEAEFAHAAPAHPEQRLGAQINLLDRAIVTLSALAGFLSENTTRGPGWRFFEIGKRLERALQMSDLMRSGLDIPAGEADPYLATLLDIADSSITYRTRYFTTLRTESVVKLLVADEANPRSVNFQLATLVGHIKNLPGYEIVPAADSDHEPLPLRLAETSLATMRGISLEDPAGQAADGVNPMADALLQLRGTLYDISEALSERHFSHITASRLMVSL